MLGKAAGDQVWRDAGEIFSGILASQPELKRHKGAMTLPAVALYRALTARGEDAEGLLNAYGEDMGKRFARIIHALISLPGADRLVWRHVGSVMEKASSDKLGYRRELVSDPRTCTAWIFYPVLTMSWQSSWGMKRLSCASVIWIRRIRRVFDISVMTAIRRFQKGPEPANTGCGLIPRKNEEIRICALSQWGRRRFRRSCLYTGFPQQPRAAMEK